MLDQDVLCLCNLKETYLSYQRKHMISVYDKHVTDPLTLLYSSNAP